VSSFYNGAFATTQLVKELEGNSVVLKDVTATDVEEINFENTSSFRLDPLGVGLKSTQQIPLDWSQFENHTFFNSAQGKTNVAFELIFNSFPFDGERSEIENFLDGLTGFEKYVFDIMPKSVGYLNFDTTNHISVPDSAGSEIPVMSRDTSGSPKIDPGLSSMTVEMQLFVPTAANVNQIVLQKLSGSNKGFTLALSESASTSNCNVDFYVTSGSSFMSASMQVDKGEFFSVAAQINRSPGVDRLYLYKNGTLISSSSTSTYFGQIDFKTSPLTIGSGSNHDVDVAYTFSPSSMLSGSIDELRVYHRNRSSTEISSSMYSTVYPENKLKLLYKFNEPTGSYTNNFIVIDHSGNGLHSNITGYSVSQRVKHVDSPMTFEKIEYSPVLFPDHPDIITLNTTLLASASQYDMNNPNLITKLIPEHYLTREQNFYVLDSVEGEVGVGIGSNNSLPRQTNLGSIQLISSILYVWAKQFDEMKCFNDHFSNLRTTDYQDSGTVSDQMIPFLAQYYGVNLPNMFRQVDSKRFVTGESISPNYENLEISFQAVQNTIWRRILHELPTILKSKGTLHAIKSLIRAAGVEPDSILKFKEYGGTSEGYILPNRSKRSIIQGMLNFSGSLFDGAVNYDPTTGVPDTLPFISSSYLSASRVEPGFPLSAGTISDGLFTSGSWSYEAFYKFEPGIKHPVTQSLIRMHVTGTASPSDNHGAIVNLIATAGTNTSSLDLYVSTNNQYQKITLTGSEIFDGSMWHISFGRNVVENEVSSSYYVWASRQNYEASNYLKVTGKYLDVSTAIDTISTRNTSGSFLCLGPQSIFQAGTFFLNNPSVPDDARESTFSGRVSGIRFWTKNLTTEELLEHTRNIESVGVVDPKINYSFSTFSSGSWERLRINAACSQEITSSEPSGKLQIFDYSQNQFHLAGSGFGSQQQVIQNERLVSSVISMQFDEAQTSNKIRVKSFIDTNTAKDEMAQIAPLYETLRSAAPQDDLRFSIEVSASRVLDEDITKIFATLDEIDSAIGSPELQFSYEYPRLDVLREIYFNRLTEKIKLKQLYEFFRWFDNSLGSLIEKFMPSNTRFLGSNYVIEPHSLERSKYAYLMSGIYLRENERSRTRSDVIVYDGRVRKS
jgi:hypothetical protein